MTKQLNFILMPAFALMLASCDQTPGDAEVREAMKASMGIYAEMFGKDMSELKVIGCAKASPAGYKCDWTSPLGAGSGRIVKSEKGWVLVEAGR